MAACYVQYDSRSSQSGPDHDKEYCYSGKIFICQGTTIFRFLRAIELNNVYYDPAHEITASGRSKVRPQWRISHTKSKFVKTLESLYDSVSEQDL